MKDTWQCSCGTAHYLRIMGDEISGFFHVEGDFRTTWRQRVKMAYRIIRNGHEDSWIEVILTPEVRAEISEALRGLHGKRSAELRDVRRRDGMAVAGQAPSGLEGAGGAGEGCVEGSRPHDDRELLD